MKKLCGLLLLLASCEQNTSEQHTTDHPVAIRPAAVRPANIAKPTTNYTSGDGAINGLNDTLHVGNLVLRLVPGSKSDFANLPQSQLPFSEARTIRQEGNGRVQRSGHTLVIRPFKGRALRFSDDTYQLRKDKNEELDTHCRFSGSVPGRPYWLVDSLQWERYQPFLINKNSGHATLLSWEPEISPDRRFLFVATPGLDTESSLNGLELLTISDQEVKVVWTKILRNWQPHQARWLDNHTLAIEQLRFEPTEKTSCVRLLIPQQKAPLR